MSEMTPPYGETNQPDDETLLERWRRCRGTPADDAAGDAIAARLRQRSKELAEARKELDTRLVQIGDLARRCQDDIETLREALSAATSRAEAMEAGIRSVAKRATAVTATWLMEQQHGLSPDWIDSDQAGEAMNSIIDECVSAEMAAIRALDTPTEGGPPQ